MRAEPATAVRVVAPGELTAAELDRWAQIQRSDTSLSSPFLSGEFTRIVGAARQDVRVAVLEDAGQVVGYFPFQRTRLGTGRPVGWGLSDHQGVIVVPGARWTADALLRGCRLTTFEFDHLLADQAPFERFHQRRRPSPYLDLTDGFEAYLAEKRSKGGEVRSAERKLRKLERERGAVAFSVHTADEAALGTLLRWKSDQYLQTGAADVLRPDWVRRTVTACHASHAPSFAGLLSVLSVDGRMVAAHLGLRSATVWHWWFPAYDPAFAAYSPGLLLLLKMAEAAPALGLGTIDLGKGDARYKQSLMSGAFEVAEGAVETRSLRSRVARLPRRARSLARRSSIGAPLRTAVRRVTRRT